MGWSKNWLDTGSCLIQAGTSGPLAQARPRALDWPHKQLATPSDAMLVLPGHAAELGLESKIRSSFNTEERLSAAIVAKGGIWRRRTIVISSLAALWPALRYNFHPSKFHCDSDH